MWEWRQEDQETQAILNYPRIPEALSQDKQTNQPPTPCSVSYIVNVNIQTVIKTYMVLYLERTAEDRWAATIYFSKEKKNVRCLHGIGIRYEHRLASSGHMVPGSVLSLTGMFKRGWAGPGQVISPWKGTDVISQHRGVTSQPATCKSLPLSMQGVRPGMNGNPTEVRLCH